MAVHHVMDHWTSGSDPALFAVLVRWIVQEWPS
jgi:hypothetical protein